MSLRPEQGKYAWIAPKPNHRWRGKVHLWNCGRICHTDNPNVTQSDTPPRFNVDIGGYCHHCLWEIPGAWEQYLEEDK